MPYCRVVKESKRNGQVGSFTFKKGKKTMRAVSCTFSLERLPTSFGTVVLKANGQADRD